MAAASEDTPPTQDALAAWLSGGGCPPDALRAVEERLAPLLNLDAAAVRLTGWAYGSLVLWVNGRTTHVAARDVRTEAKARRSDNPLAELLRAYANTRPVPSHAESSRRPHLADQPSAD